jgi:hypothetical protein
MAQPKVSPTRTYRLLPIIHSTGETLPTLVRRSDWIPARVATRWVVRRRPLNTVAVARHLGFNRKTLKKYGLDSEIAQAAARRERDGTLSPNKSKRHPQDDMLCERNDEIVRMRERCEVLIARICMAEGNAQRLGIDPAELWKPIVLPDRSVPPGRNARRSRPGFPTR